MIFCKRFLIYITYKCKIKIQREEPGKAQSLRKNKRLFKIRRTLKKSERKGQFMSITVCTYYAYTLCAQTQGQFHCNVAHLILSWINRESAGIITGQSAQKRLTFKCGAGETRSPKPPFFSSPGGPCNNCTQF